MWKDRHLLLKPGITKEQEFSQAMAIDTLRYEMKSGTIGTVVTFKYGNTALVGTK